MKTGNASISKTLGDYIIKQTIGKGTFSKVKLGIKNIWNFAPIDIKVPGDVVIENISMSESLFVLSYRLRAGRGIRDISPPGEVLL